MTNENKKRLEKFLFSLLCAFMLINNAKAQQSYDYLVTFPENSMFSPTYMYTSIEYELKIVVGDQVPTSIKITFPNNTSYVLNYTATDINSWIGKTYTIRLDRNNMSAYALFLNHTGTGEALQSLGSRYLKVASAGAPVTVYAMAVGYASIDATKALVAVGPSSNDSEIGTDYYCISYPPYPNRQTNSSYSYDSKSGYMIISGNTPSTDIYENDTYIATLAAGQTLCRYIFGNGSGNDLTGRHIHATAPIVCFAMSTQSTVPFGLTDLGDYSDVLYEQLRPVEQWGRNFVIPRIPGLAEHRIRVVAKQTTNLTVSGATLVTDAAGAQNSLTNLQAGQFVELKLESGNNGCFISADKQVSVCTFLTTGTYRSDNGTPNGDPSQVWIAPVEQMDRNVNMARFFPAINGGTAISNHYALIVVPTASKGLTTQTTDKGVTTSLASNIWYDIPSSGYSYTTVSLADDYRKTFDNSGGLIVYGYGLGTNVSYYYLAGCKTDDLTSPPGFTVNGDDYTEVDGKVYCDINSFALAAYDAPASISWDVKLNGASYSTPPSGSTASLSNLPDGDYTVTMTTNGNSYITHFHVGIFSVVWSPEANTGGTNADKQNWDIAANWTPNVVPTACNHVYIPGNCNYYPQLTNPEECNNIYFMQGGELGRADLLTYKKAFIQYNFGLKQSPQSSNSDKNLVLQNGSTTVNRLQYSAAVSSSPLARERWYLLASPLQNVLTGDFDYGGFPLTFLRKFSIVNSGGVSTGSWTTPFNSMQERINPGEGFAFYIYGWGNPSGDNSGCYELGSYNDPNLNDMTYLPNNRNSLSYGLKQTNGILELPFFADSTNLIAHRTQVYNQPASNQSTFYYIYDYGSVFSNQLTGDKETVQRAGNDGNYHLYGSMEDPITGNWVPSNASVLYDTSITQDEEFLVGNPYISSLDMISLFTDSYNSTKILNQYRIWNGSAFITYKLNSDNSTFTITDNYPTTNPGYIAPLQSFLLKTTSSYSIGAYGVFRFQSATMSKVRPIGTASNLRNDSETKEENILRIKAENDIAASYALVGYQEGASNSYVEGEDVSKLFSPLGNVPEVFTLAGDIPTDINFINNNGEIMVPLGFKTEWKGEIRLTFTGMDNFTKPTRILFFDALQNHTIDISGIASYTYTFNNTETGVQNGRFSLRFGSSRTDLPNVDNSNDLRVYNDSKGIYVISSPSDRIQHLIVYDLQGKKLYESASGANYYPMEEYLENSPLIVKVITQSQIKTVKLNNLN